MNFKIRSSVELSEPEILSHILYEIFLFGSNDEEYERNERRRKKQWKELEKDLKDIYNQGDD